ncbi:glycine--tRNA ligase subunit beta [Croceicoccus marinus]|jgi:glycyl-tRNA synthetase beta chain|uniref:Glycine--tRNA ligase beta subunit n=1 Tax=Croceicoccus marinus TaxID=450378 RepID=A0A7G6VR42_9SPHN|nr:glycine--tRNA ligase subunit beta [Croceicoccus marinus]QNE04207.1 glycine--tRNA ligase subunit beta [Croceicoccus marinus]
MTDFLLELLCEEIPARMQAGARADLERLFRAEMEAAGVSHGALTIWSTPRRLALIAADMPERTEAVSEEAKGPPEGAPDAAIDGFCKKNGVTRDQLELREVKGRNTWFAVRNVPGRAVADVLAEAIPSIVRAFPWPKSMRWGNASVSTESLRWVRPLQGIVAILGEELVSCEVGGVASGYATVGHRFHHSGEVTIGGASDYAEKLRACHVIVDHAERQDMIRTKAREAAEAAGLTLVEDEGLVIENAGLTEWPEPLLGRFDEDYLAVPPEVIQLTARVNQKYFVCEDSAGRLANAFVCTANISAADPAVIVDGNRKVLAARLSDARFFWDTDRKVPLAEQATKLARITFHEKLGTLADKVERVAKLARRLAEEGIVPGADPDLAEQAARLAKPDLVTEMVGEFPELQGLMGGYYARAEGLPDAVADAIRDHYKPVGQGDDVPTAPVTVAVSLADKLDTLRSFFAIDEKPTGSKDPFALRRAALGVIRIVTQNELRLAIAEGDLLDFFADRLKVQQREAGVRHDLIDAVFALGEEDDLVRLLARVHALQSFMETEDGANLLSGYKRAANILKKEDYKGTDDRIARTGEEDPLALVDDPELGSILAQRGHTNPDHAPEPAEAALIAALDKAAPAASDAVESERFEEAMAALASLRGPIDAFFDHVTVNDPDPATREARLALLDRFRAAVHKVADFSRIES